MSNLLPLKISFLLIVVFYLSLISASALEFGFSPGTLVFDGERCAEIELYSDSKVSIIFNEKWSEHESREIPEYNISADAFQLPESLVFKGSKKVNACLQGNPTGNGLLILDIANTSFSGGIWIEIRNDSKVEKKKELPGEAGLLPSGFVTLEPGVGIGSKKPLIWIVLLECSFLEICAASILIVLARRKKLLS